MKTQKQLFEEINKLENYLKKVTDRIKSGSPLKGDKALTKTIRNDIKTLRWVLTP